MAGNIHVPGIGDIPKPLAIGGLAAGGLIAVLVIRHRSSAGSAATAGAAGTSGVDAEGYPIGSPQDLEYQQSLTGGGNIDPLTGLPEGSPEDEAALQGQGQGIDVGEGAFPPSSAPAPTASTAPATPQDWADLVEQTLPTLGFSASTLATAVGRYIAGLSLTSDQANMIYIALSEVPYPGTPPKVIQSAAPSPTGPKASRHVSGGNETLEAAAKRLGTTASGIIDATQTGDSPTNLAKFNAYVSGGTNKKMPRGLIYYAP